MLLDRLAQIMNVKQVIFTDASFTMGLLLFSLLLQLFQHNRDIKHNASAKYHGCAAFPVGNGNGSIANF